ncbi:MAG: glutamate synthase subunit beta [Chloroflexi bacterium]|nr:glutamate synthase subunit beta [Chloroflexota bacterium]
MAKPTGFIDYKRDEGKTRPPQERIGDWQPIQLHMPDEPLQTQAARCMDCGIPFCHQGQILNGMSSGCPLHNLIPEWNDLIYQGLWREAYERLSKTNNFPEFTGLVCPAPCEASCTLGIIDPPVTIKNIEYAIVEKAFAEGWVRPDMPRQRTGKKVAVIGSGPAGLACAEQLNLVGHEVTVFERADRPGGLLVYGIPNMKLGKKLVQRRLDLLTEAGIRFVTNTEIGRDISADQLRAEFDAIILCTGAARPRDLDVPGREKAGIHFALEFLTGSTKALLEIGDQRLEIGDATSNLQSPITNLQSPISATNKDVIIIGGGDTGTDCVATAVRQQCRSVIQFEIMPRPPQERAPDNPWPQWPRIYRLDYGQEEAQAVFGDDPRRYLVMTKRFVGNGRVQGVETINVTWETDGWRPQLVEIPGTEKVWPAQLVLLAMGFTGPENGLLDQLGVKLSRWRDEERYGRYHTNVEGVFAAGDGRRGQSLVVWAIREGRGAAREVDRWLMGETDLP